MVMILKAILEKMDKVKRPTNSYIDNILVGKSKVSAREAMSHLKCFGLTAKPPEAVEGGAAVGCKQWRDKAGVLMFQGGNEIPGQVGENYFLYMGSCWNTIRLKDNPRQHKTSSRGELKK